jgi:hypothetical protein
MNLAKHVSSIWYSMVVPTGIYLFFGKTLVEWATTQETATKLKVNILDWSKAKQKKRLVLHRK